MGDLQADFLLFPRPREIGVALMAVSLPRSLLRSCSPHPVFFEVRERGPPGSVARRFAQAVHDPPAPVPRPLGKGSCSLHLSHVYAGLLGAGWKRAGGVGVLETHVPVRRAGAHLSGWAWAPRGRTRRASRGRETWRAFLCGFCVYLVKYGKYGGLRVYTREISVDKLEKG